MASEITPQEISRKLSELAEAGRKPATVNRYRALLSLVFSVANRNEKLTINPVRFVRHRRENNSRIRFLNEKEEQSLREVITKKFPDKEPEFDLALHTGMRRGEQFRLRWQDIDLRLGIITIPRSKHGEKRHIPINSVARRALTVLWRKRDDSGYVCSGPKSSRGKDSRRWFEKEVILGSGVKDFRWHDLRHTFASRLVMAGVHLRTVQELMGHKTIDMTVRYSHLAPGHQMEAVERLAGKPTDTSTDTKEKLDNEAEIGKQS